MTARIATLAGSVVGGFLASVCCIVPLAFTALGISGAAYALRFEPLRPYLLVLTYGLLASAAYVTYRALPSCAPGEPCATRPAGRAGKLALWLVAVVVVLTTLFPSYAAYLFGGSE